MRDGSWETKGWELEDEGVGAGRQRDGSWETVGWEKNSLGRKLTLYVERWERVPVTLHLITMQLWNYGKEICE